MRLLPSAQAPELRIEGQHVRERSGARARQAVDVDRPVHGEGVDLGMFHVPRFDLEPIRESTSQVTDDPLARARREIAVALEAGEELAEADAEVTGTEVGAAGRLPRLGEQLLGGRVGAHRYTTRSG